jgi:hypothetical protein
MQKHGQPSTDDGDALALTFPQAVAPAEVGEHDEDEEMFGGYSASAGSCTSGTARESPISKLYDSPGGAIPPIGHLQLVPPHLIY